MKTFTDTVLTPERPWPGLDSYNEEAAGYFFGRGKETKELSARVKREIITLLFGKPGLGKSSLLKAGLFPILRGEGYFPVYLRVDYSSGAPKVFYQMQAALSQTAERYGCSIAFPSAAITAWEIFHSRYFGIQSAGGEFLSPVIVFDQFEELFTLGRDIRQALAEEVVDTIESLAENRLPLLLEEKMRDDSGLADSFDFDVPGCKIVLSLREDFLPYLETLRRRIPKLSYSRMRLEPMDGEKALDAIVRPGADLVAEADSLVILDAISSSRWQPGNPVPDFEVLQHREVSPALLSLLCSELNERRIASAKARITADLVQDSRDRILHGFYERCFDGITASVRHFVEDELVTSSGFRKRQELNEAIKLGGVPQDELDSLTDRRLLRYEESGGATWVELTHDLLVETVLTSRRDREANEQLKAAQAKVLEARNAEKTRRMQSFALGGIALVFFALGCVALFFLQSARKAQSLAEKNLTRFKEEQTHSRSLSKQKQEALQTASRLSDSLKDLSVIALEDKDNSVQVVSPLFKDLLLNYIATIEKKTVNDRDLPPEVELNLRLSRVTVALMTMDLDAALRECNEVLAQLPQLRVQDPRYLPMFFRLKGDILDEKAFRARFKPRNDRKAEWIRAIQCFQHAADGSDAGTDEGRLLQATMEVRIGHVIEYLSKTYCPAEFSETNEPPKGIDSAKEAPDAAANPTAFLDFNHRAFERINAALVSVKGFALTHPDNPEGLRAEADAENKLGNLVKERYESGFVTNAAEIQQLVDTAITRYREALETRGKLLRINNDSPSDRVAVALIQANLGETYGLLIDRDPSWISEASKYLDGRIETCNRLLMIDPTNPYFKSLLRRGYLNKIYFLVKTVKTSTALSEAHDLLSSALYLDPETIREEDLANLEQLCSSLDLQTQWQACLATREGLRRLKSNP